MAVVDISLFDWKFPGIVQQEFKSGDEVTAQARPQEVSSSQWLIMT
jgi:hypothetical protein